MSMSRTVFSVSAALAFAAAIAAFSPGSASADSTATRCDEDGCSRIVCDDTGNDCRNLYDDFTYDRRSRYGTRDCDADDPCYRHRDDFDRYGSRREDDHDCDSDDCDRDRDRD
jgi:hypothetical protein